MQFLLLVLCVISFSFQSLFTKLYSDHYRGNAETSVPVFSVVYGAFIAIASLVTGSFSFAPSPLTVLFGILNGLILILYNTAIIRAEKLGSYSFMMIVNLFGAILLPILAGIIFLGETISVTGILAVALMLPAMLLMNHNGLSVKSTGKKYYLWCLLLFLANGLYGTFLNVQATLMNGRERTEMLVILFFLSSVLTVLYETARGRAAALKGGFCMGAKAGIFLILSCVFATVGANLVLYLFSVMNTDVVCTVDNGGVIILSILYALILFREKPDRLQWIGMMLATASIVLINF